MRIQRNTARGVVATAGAVLAAGFIAACAGNEPTAARFPAPPENLTLSVGPIDVAGDGQAEVEKFEICKLYAEGSGPATTFDWAVTFGSDVGAPGSSGTVTLGHGECWEVWGGDADDNSITVTETVPAGYSVEWSKDEIVRTGDAGSGITTTTTYGPFAGNVADGRVGGGVLGAAIPGTTVTFTNTLIPPPENLEGRMTGGGFTVAGIKITGGFTVHCDITLSNNLQINWDNNKWHLDKPITSALCLDDPNVDPTSPAAPFDTFIGEGLGELNGVAGSLVKFTFVDAGEPGRNDMVKLQIFPPGGGTPVLDIPLSKLDIGNLQAHYDQPHKK